MSGQPEQGLERPPDGGWHAIGAAFALYFGIWLVLTSAAKEGLVFGVAGALFAALVTRHFISEFGVRGWPLHPVGWVRFAPWFLRRSLVGSWDVMRRAMLPGLPLQPDWVIHSLRLRDPAARHFMAATVGLLPGTLVAAIEGDELRVHALDTCLDVAADLRELEVRVGALFGETGVESGEAGS
ncbi:MAG: Na+/H+ antiporter subunit E [Pseudomonadota bacterium]